MDEKDDTKSLWGRGKAFWNSVPEALRLLGTILGIIIAFKALFPAAVVEINTFDASPEIIESGDPSILSWDVSGADNISIEPGLGDIASTGSLSVSPSETTTYKLIAKGNGKEDVALRTVTVKNEPILIDEFNTSPGSIESGKSATLTWKVTGVENVTIEPEIGTVAAEGSSPVSPQQTTTYKLIAFSGEEEKVAYSTVTVEDSSGSEEQIPAGQNLTPDLTSENNVPVQPVSPPQENLPSASVPAQENPPSQENLPAEENSPVQEDLPSVGSFNAVPDVIGKGESSNLTWSVSEATSVSIEPGIGTVALTGSQRVFPAETTTYTLTALNKAGSVEATKVIYVQQAPDSEVPAPTSAPKQISPANGTVFDSSAQGATLQWSAVSGAASYTVEIDMYSPDTSSWLSESSGSWIIPGISTTSYSFEFPASGTGRWRVWAVSQEGAESEKSNWLYFNYMA